MPAHETFNRLRVLSGVLLVVAIFLPLYATPTSFRGDLQLNHVWDVARGDLVGSIFLVLAYAGPALTILLHRRRLSHAGSMAFLIAEPFVLSMSAAILMTVAKSAFTLLPLFGPWMLIPASATIGAGTWLALFADGMLLLLWVASAGWRLRRNVAVGTATA